MSSHESSHTGWQGWIIRQDNRVPFIFVAVILSAMIFTVGEQMNWHTHHLLHNKTFHLVANHHGMWIFFAYLGLEITIKSLFDAGKFVALATVGGMVVPPLLTYLLTGNLYIAIGACATDVAFSIGASKLVQGGDVSILKAMIVALLILAVGDDMGGVGILAGMYANGISMPWIIAAVLVIVFSYFCGERGFVGFTVEEVGGKSKTFRWHVEIRSIMFWMVFAGINTAILIFAGIEWILGGCLVFILATQNVKDALIHRIKPMIPIILFVFGLANGGINLLDRANWGPITLGAFLGGMFGKQIGIFAGGLLGRAWSLRTEPQNRYSRTTLRELSALALFGSVNGTVAIFFVTMGASKGFISSTDASQAILGYFMTVPAVYLLSIISKVTGVLIVRDHKTEDEEAPSTVENAA